LSAASEKSAHDNDNENDNDNDNENENENDNDNDNDNDNENENENENEFISFPYSPLSLMSVGRCGRVRQEIRAKGKGGVVVCYLEISSSVF
jgi:hypothetical protein